jgi:F-type H+-transporting ATPase subunit b
MFSIDLTFVWTAVNLFVIFFFVRKFLFKRLAKSMDERSELIAEGLKKGEDLKREHQEFEAQRDTWRRDMSARSKTLLDESKLAAEREAGQIIRDARDEAARIKEEARWRVENERLTMIAGLKRETINLALTAASGILKENIDDERNRALTEGFITRAGHVQEIHAHSSDEDSLV